MTFLTSLYKVTEPEMDENSTLLTNVSLQYDDSEHKMEKCIIYLAKQWLSNSYVCR
jgi:hypothetical protein